MSGLRRGVVFVSRFWLVGVWVCVCLFFALFLVVLAGKGLVGILHSLYARPVQSTSADSNLSFPKRIPKWLLWSLLTIVLCGTWGLVAKIASTGVDAYMNQLLYTAGLAPLMVFVAITVRREQGKVSANRNSGIFCSFFTGILGGVGNIAIFQALVMGGKASVVAPV